MRPRRPEGALTEPWLPARFVPARLRGCLLTWAICLAATGAAAQAPPIVARVQIQGNTLTPDAQVLSIAGLRVGMPFEADTVEAAAARLKADGRFDRVQVLKRFASISDPSQIALVVLLHEPGVTIAADGNGPARVVKRHGPGLQYLPLLAYEDGYGWTYGLQTSRPGVLGRESRLSFPFTWGGEREAAAIVSKSFDAGPITRVEGGGSLTRRVHPFYGEPENRGRLWLRAERAFGSSLRVGLTADRQHVTLASSADQVPSIGADFTLDTRVDPWLARNAVLVKASWQRAGFPGSAANLTELDAIGYIGLPGQPVLVVRARHEGADAHVPPYAREILGGTDNLRAFRPGMAVGDKLAAGSIELREPLSSPLQMVKVGVTTFVDVAAVYDKGEHLRDQTFSQGVGVGIWLSIATVRFTLSIAHGIGSSTRLQFSAGLLD
jgi:outer membrane protein assembly factor BamA